MQQLNVHDYYDLGKKVDNIEREVKKTNEAVPANSVAWSLFLLRWQFSQMIKEPCALLPASQRAAKSVMKAIGEVVTSDIDDLFKIGPEELIQPYQMRAVGTAINDFETVFKNDMPEMSTFAVAQIGIYRTEDLINRSSLQIDESMRQHLLPLALSDVTEAGKCLAFRLSTAAAFHMSRAIETGMNQYFEAITGKSYDLKPAANNWAIKTQTLKDAGAEEKITEFLTHIRKAYRNPITHPEVIMDATEAFGFFSQAVSVISLMLAAVKELEDKKQPALPGILIGTDALSTSSSSLLSAVLGAGDS